MQRLSALGSAYDCSFVSFPHRYRNRSIPDEDVPDICRREDAAALITINYKDFASKVGLPATTSYTRGGGTPMFFASL